MPVSITSMVGITFMVFITFMGDTSVSVERSLEQLADIY